MNQTPPKVVYLVIFILGVLAFISVSSLCATLFFKNYADPAVLTSIIAIASALVGSLGTLLVNTRSQTSAGQTTSTITTTTLPPPPTEPAKVEVVNKDTNPVPVEPQT